MITTLKKLLEVSAGLAALDTVRFSGDEAVAARLALARNRIAVKQHLDAFDEARVATIRDLTNGRDAIEPGTDEAHKFQTAMDGLLNQPLEVKLWRIPWSAIERSDVSGTAMVQLWDLLRGIPAPPEPDC